MHCGPKLIASRRGHQIEHYPKEISLGPVARLARACCLLPVQPSSPTRQTTAAWSAGFSFEVWAELHYLQAQSWLETILPTTGGSQIIPHRTLILHSWHNSRLLKYSPRYNIEMFGSSWYIHKIRKWHPWNIYIGLIFEICIRVPKCLDIQ